MNSDTQYVRCSCITYLQNCGDASTIGDATIGDASIGDASIGDASIGDDTIGGDSIGDDGQLIEMKTKLLAYMVSIHKSGRTEH